MIYAWIIDAIVFIFRSRIGVFIVSALAWLGITYGTQKIVTSTITDQLQGFFSSMGTGGDLGTAALAWLGVLNLDKAITMIVSAIATKSAIGAARVRFLKR